MTSKRSNESSYNGGGAVPASVDSPRPPFRAPWTLLSRGRQSPVPVQLSARADQPSSLHFPLPFALRSERSSNGTAKNRAAQNRLLFASWERSWRWSLRFFPAWSCHDYIQTSDWHRLRCSKSFPA